MNNKNFNNKPNIRNKTDYSNNNIINSIQKNTSGCNSSYDRSLQQSPKIRTGKYRPLSSRTKPFSLIDFDDKRLISKGSNFDQQYKRLPEEELSKFISQIKQIAGDNKNKKKIIQNFINKNDKNKNIKNENIKNENNKNNDDNNNKEIINYEINKDDEKKNNNNSYNNNFNKKRDSKKLTIETKDIYEINKIHENYNANKEIHRKEKHKKIKKEFEENKNSKTIFTRPLSAQLRQKKDRWLPKDYPHYEYYVLNQKYFQENLKKNPFINKTKITNLKEITQKSNQSDIFFLGPQSEKETKLLVNQNKDKLKNYNIKLGSDVFNIKNDFSNLMKSSETYLFKNKNYPISSESKSFWTARPIMPTYMNYPSVEYNILNPRAKCNTKTKEQIYNQCMQKKKNENNNSVNYMNPIFRQKNISSFYDITKGGMNRNLAYEKIINDNPRSYYRKNDVCTLQYDLYKDYRGIIEKPFVTHTDKKIQF